MKATFVKSVEGQGHKALYKLNPPLEGHEFVVVSSVHAMFTGPETYIFPADKNGKVTNWGELPGSYRGGLNHIKALEDAGYTALA